MAVRLRRKPALPLDGKVTLPVVRVTETQTAVMECAEMMYKNVVSQFNYSGKIVCHSLSCFSVSLQFVFHSIQAVTFACGNMTTIEL